MAVGDLVIFDEYKREYGEKIHDLSNDTFKCAILDNTTTPTAATATPRLGDFTEVGTAGSYVAGGTDVVLTHAEVGGTVTVDCTVNPSWAVHASNDVDAYWALIYNSTSVGDEAIGFVDLGGPFDMTAFILSLTFGANLYDLT